MLSCRTKAATLLLLVLSLAAVSTPVFAEETDEEAEYVQEDIEDADDASVPAHDDASSEAPEADEESDDSQADAEVTTDFSEEEEDEATEQEMKDASPTEEQLEGSVDDVQEGKLRCPRLHVRNSAGKCVPAPKCGDGEYRFGTKCKRLPSTTSCEAQVKALRKRKREEDPMREKEMHIIKTIRSLLVRLTNVKSAAEQAQADVEIKDLLPLLQTATTEQRQTAEVNGPKGVMFLLNQLEQKLKADAILAQQEVNNLFKHCKDLCKEKILFRKGVVKQWEGKKAFKEQQIANVTANIGRWEGKINAFKLELKDAENTYARMKAQRDEENALVDWLIKKADEVVAVKFEGLPEEQKAQGNGMEDMQLEAQDWAKVVTAIDMADPKFAGVITLMQRNHTELTAIKNLLNEIKQKNIDDDRKDLENLAKMRAKLATWEAHLAKLKEILRKRKEQLQNIIDRLKLENAKLNTLRNECAKFGASEFFP